MGSVFTERASGTLLGPNLWYSPVWTTKLCDSQSHSEACQNGSRYQLSKFPVTHQQPLQLLMVDFPVPQTRASQNLWSRPSFRNHIVLATHTVPVLRVLFNDAVGWKDYIASAKDKWRRAEQWWNDRMTEKTKHSKKILFQWHFVHHKSNMDSSHSQQVRWITWAHGPNIWLSRLGLWIRALNSIMERNR